MARVECSLMSVFNRQTTSSAETRAGANDPAASSGRGGGRRLSSFLAVTWLLLAAVDSVLVFSVAGTMAFEGRLPAMARVALLATELTVLAVFVVVFFGPIAMWLQRWKTTRRKGGALISALLFAPPVALVGMVFFFFGVSWGSFRTTARFLDLEAFRLWAANPVQMVQHVMQTELSRLVVVVVIAALGAVFLVATAVWLAKNGNRHALRRLSFVAVLGLVVSFGLALSGHLRFNTDLEPVTDPESGAVSLLGEVYRAARADRSGPATHAVVAARQKAWTLRRIEGAGDIRIIRRKQVPMQQYLDTIDPGASRDLNVVVILLESLRPDQLRSYGGRREVMPALDQLASAGRVFSKAYCQANNSFAGDPCALSGQYPVRSRGMHIYPVNPPYPRVLIWDVLKALGYRTAIISSQNEGWGRMIDFFDTGNLDTIFHAETASESTYVESPDSAFAAWIKETEMAGKLDDRVTVDAAIRWIDEQPDVPFFCYLNLQSSHLPYRVPEGFERPYGPSEIDFNLAFGSYPKNKSSVVKDLYADSLRYMDEQLERLFEHLEQRGLFERTILVVSGDSGEAFYEHGFSAHANKIFNEVMHVPFIVRSPGLASGISATPAQHVDIPSTIFGLLGLPPHPSFQGLDLLQPPPPDRSLYLSVQLPGAHQFGIVRGDHKLIYDVQDQNELLFDLSRDPGETRDLSTEMPELTEALQARLYAWYDAQISYYEDSWRMQREYPPVVAD